MMSWVHILFGKNENTKEFEISDMLNRVINKIDRSQKDDKDILVFYMDDGDRYAMFHDQQCCENVEIKDIVGDLDDLCGTPLLVAEEVTKTGEHEEGTDTWTFYKFRTIKGSVDITWYGSSNGYYSESVDFYKWVKKEKSDE